MELDFYQFSTATVLLMLAAFYGGTYLLTLMIRKKNENADAYMVANQRIGLASSSMTATWIWD